jgi:protocatechuate 3,4-dioxygenase alpha subunit
MSGITPSQTVGPYFAYGLTPTKQYDWSDAFTNNLITPDAVGEKIRVEGIVRDGDGAVIPDAMIEIWQADGQGRYIVPTAGEAKPNTAFRGFGRCGTNKDGYYSFDTVKPGPVPGPDGKPQAPHIVVCYFSRGLLTHLFTRIYFSDEAGNASDPILAQVPAERRATLIATKADKPGVYTFNIRPQGDDDETVFFDI